MKTKYFKYLYICMLLAVFGCEEFKDFDVTEKPYIDKSSVVLYIGEHAGDKGTAQLHTSPIDAGYVWTSQDPSIVTVDQKGLIKAVAEGSTSIIVSSSNDQTVVDVNVKEYVPLTGFTLNSHTVVGGWYQDTRVYVTPIPVNASEVNIEWSTSDETVARVFDNGVIRTLRPGSTTVTAKFGDVEQVVDVLVPIKMPKDGWRIPGYNADSDDGTIGYSSQQRGDGGGVPSIIDTNYDTYWHARYGGSGSNYPHWFIIDLGEEVVIPQVSMARRKGDARGQRGYQVFTCTESGATNLADPTTWAWVDSGDFGFNHEKDGDQKVTLSNFPRARYVKVFIADKYRGSNNYAMVGDFSVYAPPTE